MDWDKPVPWVQKSLDFMNKVYWTTDYVGMKKVGEDANGISLYGRARKAPPHRDHLLRREEFLNQSFDIAFAIAPDALIGSVILGPLGFADQGPFLSVGKEVSARQLWPKNSGLMQQDGLFVSSNTVVAVEMKTGSPTSRNQTLKYLCMLALEEAAKGRKDHLGMLYLVSEGSVAKTRTQAGLGTDGRVAASLESLQVGKVSDSLKKYLADHAAEVEDVRKRLLTTVLSWREFDDRLAVATAELAGPDAGGQTLRRLVDGLRVQIRWQTGEGTAEAPLLDF